MLYTILIFLSVLIGSSTVTPRLRVNREFSLCLSVFARGWI